MRRDVFSFFLIMWWPPIEWKNAKNTADNDMAIICLVNLQDFVLWWIREVHRWRICSLRITENCLTKSGGNWFLKLKPSFSAKRSEQIHRSVSQLQILRESTPRKFSVAWKATVPSFSAAFGRNSPQCEASKFSSGRRMRIHRGMPHAAIPPADAVSARFWQPFDYCLTTVWLLFDRLLKQLLHHGFTRLILSQLHEWL